MRTCCSALARHAVIVGHAVYGSLYLSGSVSALAPWVQSAPPALTLVVSCSLPAPERAQSDEISDKASVVDIVDVKRVMESCSCTSLESTTHNLAPQLDSRHP